VSSNQPLKPRELVKPESAVSCEQDGIEPELRLGVGPAHVHVWRFVAISRIEKEAIRVDPQDRRHR